MSLFIELKRRNVFRVAIAYSITAWLIAQIAGLSASSFLAPEWVMKMIITLLILGFPVAMLMAWAYELTPDGLRREADIEPGQSMAQVNAGKLNRTITITLILAVVYFSYDKFILDPKRDAALLETASRQTTEVRPQPATTEQSQLDQASSIAVLPFVNMSDDAGNEYFSEGLSEELLNLLVRIPQLRVAARTSSFSYKGKDTKIAQIGEELNVTHVLEGSVRKSGNQLRITAQLIKADDGFHLWSQTYDRTLDNIFQIQDEIATAVVDGLKITLLGAMPETRNTDPEVYSLYLHGKYFNNLRGEENVEKAVLAFKQALAIDPDYALAWVGIAWAYDLQVRSRTRPQVQGVALARNAVERALAIDDKLAIVWSSLAYLKKTYEWDWQGAQAAMDKALQLEPNNADVLGAAASLASSLGQLDKSIELFERDVALDPLGLPGLIALGNRYRARGRYDEALAKYNQIVVLNPEFPWVRQVIVLTYLGQGEPERALAELNKWPANLRAYGSIKVAILFRLGEEMEARAITNELLETSAREDPLGMAITYATQGDNDSAFKWLDVAFEQRARELNNILWHDGLVPLRNDPRYLVIVEKLGLLEAWKAMPSH